jgi:hypothetical protein
MLGKFVNVGSPKITPKREISLRNGLGVKFLTNCIALIKIGLIIKSFSFNLIS